MKIEKLIDELEKASVITTLGELSGEALFDIALDMLNYDYSNPGEPEATCGFCGRSIGMMGCHGEEVFTAEEIEAAVERWLDGDLTTIIPDDVYWVRVWATRALDLINRSRYDEPCCEERAALLDELGL